MLVPAGLDARIAGRAVDLLGPPASRLLREDPWRLLELVGISPDDADRLARSAIPGVQRDDPRRARALVGWVLAAQAREGHTVSPVQLVVDALGPLGVGDAAQAVSAALDTELVEAIDAAVDGATDRDEPMIALSRYAEAEEGIAEAIARLVATASPITVRKADRATPDLDEAQRRAVHSALECGVSVLTGGPGTGKSRTVSTLVTMAEAAGKTVALAAPTGRAAKRLEELCGSPASTLHRLLGAQTAPVRRRRHLRRRFRARRGMAAGRGRGGRGRGVHARRRTRRMRCCAPVRTAPTCCSSATPRSCPRSGRGGCSAI